MTEHVSRPSTFFTAGLMRWIAIWQLMLRLLHLPTAGHSTGVFGSRRCRRRDQSAKTLCRSAVRLLQDVLRMAPHGA